MFNHTHAKAFVTAACALAIALLTIGMGVNSSWAESDQPSGLNIAPISTDVVVQPLTSAGHPHRSITLPRLAVVPPASFTPIIYYAAFACMDFGQPCGGTGQQAYPPCCQGYVCHIQGGNMYGRCLHR